MNLFKINKNPVIQLDRSKYITWLDSFVLNIPIVRYDFSFGYWVCSNNGISGGFMKMSNGWIMIMERILA